MTARKSKESGDFWGKVLSASKVRRILQQRGFDPEAFRRDYESDTSRSPRSPRRPTTKEMDAVEAFQKSGDFDAFKHSLDTRSAAVANSTLRRVLQYKAQGGIKTVRVRRSTG